MAEDKIPCAVCGELVEPWTRFHWAKPFTDPENPGHYVDGGSRNLGAGPQETTEGEGLAPPPPERPKYPKGLEKLLAPSEDDVRREIVNYLDLSGWDVWDLEQGYRAGPGGARVTSGMSDVVAVGFGLVAFIEMKSPKGQTARKKQRPGQARLERAVLGVGGTYLLVESLEQVKTWEKNHRRNFEQKEIELGT